MRNDLNSLDLTFPSLLTGERETPPSLTRLLYKGGASHNVTAAIRAIQDGALGAIIQDRVELVRLIYDSINGDLVSGGSAATCRTQIAILTYFFRWADSVDAPLDVAGVAATYFLYAEHLLNRVRTIKDLKAVTAYNKANTLGAVLDKALGRSSSLIRRTRLTRPKPSKKPQSAQTDKQNLHDTFVFGRLLQNICDETPIDVLMGSHWSVSIPLQDGGKVVLHHSCRARLPDDQRTATNKHRTAAALAAYTSDRSLNHPFRQRMANLRIEAEFMMFVGQTGMNVSQAMNLCVSSFRYAQDLEGYRVREYKPRRQGEVQFEIFREYRSHLERYLDWRRALFQRKDGEDRLFPIIRRAGTRKDLQWYFYGLRSACAQAGIAFVTAKELRGTRVNWILRRSGDPDLTADMAQHHKQTLLSNYERPSLQRAISEVGRFHLRTDPALAYQSLSLAAAPGECNGVAKAVPTIPKSAPTPDCRRPSGCLWCEHHRDIDSFDYVWSLACFWHLKTIEVSKQALPAKGSDVDYPAAQVKKRLQEKLLWFRNSNAKRSEWVEEALARVEEGHYHEQWSYIIEAMEGLSK